MNAHEIGVDRKYKEHRNYAKHFKIALARTYCNRLDCHSQIVYVKCEILCSLPPNAYL